MCWREREREKKRKCQKVSIDAGVMLKLEHRGRKKKSPEGVVKDSRELLDLACLRIVRHLYMFHHPILHLET